MGDDTQARIAVEEKRLSTIMTVLAEIPVSDWSPNAIGFSLEKEVQGTGIKKKYNISLEGAVGSREAKLDLSSKGQIGFSCTATEPCNGAYPRFIDYVQKVSDYYMKMGIHQ